MVIDGIELEGSELEVITPTTFQSGQEVDGIELEGSELEVIVPTGFQAGQEIDGVELEGSELDTYVGELGILRLLKAELEPDVDQPGMGTQFMVLNQYQTPLKPSLEIENIYNYYDLFESSSEEKIASSSYDYRKNKDIVWYGRTGVYANSINESEKLVYQQRVFDDDSEFFESKYGQSYDSVYPIQLNNKGFVGIGINESSFHTGSIRIAAPLKSISITKNSFAIPLTRTTSSLNGVEDEDRRFTTKRSYMYGETLGGRNLFDVTNGRSYVGSVVGGERSESFEYKGVSFDGYNVDDKISPYILMPDDKLFIACAHQPAPYDISDYLTFAQVQNQPSIESNTAQIFRTKLQPGIGKVVFYGTYLRDGKPIEPESSQPLTSLAVHEDVKGSTSPYGNSYCSDQFQLEPSTTFRKSYVDRLYEGSTNLSGSSPRELIELSVDGNVGSKWSLQRFVRLFNERETYYDSHVPLVESTLSAILDPSSYVNNEVKIQSSFDFFPFQASLTSIPRSENINDASKSSDPNSKAIESFEFGNPILFQISNDDISSLYAVALTFAYGSNYGLPLAGSDPSYFSVLRGFRYGLANVQPKARSAVFRHDRYGQFRDMLEPTLDSTFYEEIVSAQTRTRRLGSSPVSVKFLDANLDPVEPVETSSQNLSFFATSSIPYFDGEQRDR